MILHHFKGHIRCFLRFISDDALSFDRDTLHFEPAPFVPHKELIEKITKRKGEGLNKSKNKSKLAKSPDNRIKEEIARHPDERRGEDLYVNEVQDANEKDYKEGP